MSWNDAGSHGKVSSGFSTTAPFVNDHLRAGSAVVASPEYRASVRVGRLAFREGPSLRSTERRNAGFEPAGGVIMEGLVMPELENLEGRRIGPEPLPGAVSRPAFRHVLACVDSSSFARAVLAHAAAVAVAMGARLTVMQVLEPMAAGQAPTDPVEWDLRHREVVAEVERLASGAGRDVGAEALVVEGPAAERICEWAREHKVDLTVLGACGESGWCECGLGGTARRVAESVPGSVLLMPTTEVGDEAVRYHRVMTPLDCSSRAECALPVAVSIAAAHNAEMILVHATPDVQLTEVAPLETDDLELRDGLRRRNVRVAQRYLKQIQAQLLLNGDVTRALLLPSGDPRHALARAVSDQGIDVIVLSSSGLSGHPDLSVGSVAEYLMSHTATPILLVRGQTVRPPARRRRPLITPRQRLPSRTRS
jgi:nucleotide-binding universal stress UspA family protein